MSTYTCPLCSETYGEQTTLHVHLEVEHRKSAVVSSLIDTVVDDGDTTAERDGDENRVAPSA